MFREKLNIDAFNNTVTVTEQLHSKLYAQVKNVINRLGGKWQGQKGYFQFVGRPAEELIARALETGTRRLNKFHYYPTPKSVFDFIVEWTSLNYVGCSDSPTRVLEPSCGEGGLITELQALAEKDGRNFQIEAYEIDPLNALMAEQTGVKVTLANFLEVEPEPVFDLVVMNPPFDNISYIDHIQHAQKFLAPHGVLISVVPTNFITRWVNNDQCRWLMERAAMQRGSTLDPQDYFGKNTFKGVSINTTVIEIESEQRYQETLASRAQALTNEWYCAASNEDLLKTEVISSYLTDLENDSLTKERGKSIYNKMNKGFERILTVYGNSLNVAFMDRGMLATLEEWAPQLVEYIPKMKALKARLTANMTANKKPNVVPAGPPIEEQIDLFDFDIAV
ncbi:class I SAM-dependent methyltransferase [Reinekea sp. G2M2-21]|uniref:class I SAM-dependent methyltransferase n=1 Tax=Reinekea sp. G2M2-21 TaxID=2788942 RepID=UPI0018AABC17|nr:class I SAM-dependent methyltransferase [Reinekea sp. G2M2-21]